MCCLDSFYVDIALEKIALAPTDALIRVTSLPAQFRAVSLDSLGPSDHDMGHDMQRMVLRTASSCILTSLQSM